VDCTQFNEPYYPYDLSISLYTSIAYISRYFVSMNGIQTPIIISQCIKTMNLSWCLVCKGIIILNVRLTRIDSNPLDWHQLHYWIMNMRSKFFIIAVLPQRGTYHSRHIRVASNSFFFFFFNFVFWFWSKNESSCA